MRDSPAVATAADPPSRLALAPACGTERWPLDERPLVLGRLPESDIVVPDPEVSRVHACIVPTPHGPILVSRGKHGTRLNGEFLVAPRCLALGDEITIGRAVYRLGLIPASPPVAETGHRLAGKLKAWVRRYGPSEIFGTIAAVVAAVGVEGWTGSTIAGAYAGALSETTVFYGIFFFRESVREAHRAGARGRPFTSTGFLRVIHSLMLEFGAAEVVDLFVVRPFCMAVGLHWLGGKFGALTGKLAADILFYGPVLTIHEWRLAGGGPAPEDPRRRTTARYLRPPAG